MTVGTGLIAPKGSGASSRFSITIPNERTVLALTAFVVLLILWQLSTSIDLDPEKPGTQGLIKKVLMSSPTDIAAAGFTAVVSGEIWPHLWMSTQEWVLGFMLAIIVGIPLGFMLGWFRRFRLLMNYWLFAVDATPSIAIFPLIVLVLGIGLESKVFLVFLAAVFQVTIATMTGVRSVAFGHMQIAQSFRANTRLLLRSVVLPTTLPFVLTGIRLGSARALVGVISAEFLVATNNQGLGFWIQLGGQTLASAKVFVGLVFIGFLGIIIGEIVRVAERRFDVWRPAIHK